ncbi:MAG TPA: serine hydrolase domain-containing protein [Vicinamibacterales bacterium]|nr:serine hydrolase domain-containing protein [Vicinamibacterales bacterium]
MPDALPGAAGVLREGVADRAFPGAVLEVGRSREVVRREAFGALTFGRGAPPTRLDTIFDLASLTKVIATATLTMRAVDDGRLRLDEPLAERIPEWRGVDRESVTIRDVLAHASGLTAYLPFYRDLTGRAEFQRAISTLPLEYPPRTQSIYSDLGFILLGFVLEDAHPARAAATPGTTDLMAGLDAQFQRLASFLTADPLVYRPARALRPRIAPTEIDAWRGRLIVGEVHDENAWALGGVAGHAGLFGTAAAVGAFARAALRTIAGEPILAGPATMREFIRRAGLPASSRALGWDTTLPSSSSGTLMSPTAIGHTGFTGTSLWIDWERDLYIVLLTNRVHPTRENEKIRQVRPRLHDAVLRDVFRL